MGRWRLADTVTTQNWHLAARSEAIGRRITECALPDRVLALYRGEAGGIVALDQMCPHAFVPFAWGLLDGDVVECRAHGWKFGPDGKSRSKWVNYTVQSYPVREQDGEVWVDLGETKPQRRYADDEDEIDESEPV